MEGDQGDHQLVKAFAARKRGAVDRVKARHPQRGRVTNVVQPGCRHKAVSTGYVEMPAKPVGNRCDPTHVCESTRHSVKP